MYIFKYRHLYNRSQQDALFLNFILIYNSTCFGQTLLPIIRSLDTVFTANWYLSYYLC